MKTMKTFLITIFTVLTTLSFSQNPDPVINEEGTLVEIEILTISDEDTLKVKGALSQSFTVEITNNSMSNLYVGTDFLAKDDEIELLDISTSDTISITNSSGTLIITFTNTNAVGLKENTQTVFSLYPNPTTDFLNIKGDNVETVKVFNTSGQMVLSDNGSNFGDTKLDVTSLKNGAYMVMVNDGKPVRFIKR